MTILLSTVLLLMTILLCIKLNNPESIKVPILGDNLEIIKKEPEFEGLLKMPDNYYRFLCSEYIDCLRDAESKIDSKSKWLNRSIVVFVVGIIVLPLSVVLDYVF